MIVSGRQMHYCRLHTEINEIYPPQSYNLIIILVVLAAIILRYVVGGVYDVVLVEVVQHSSSSPPQYHFYNLKLCCFHSVGVYAVNNIQFLGLSPRDTSLRVDHARSRRC